jgi:hypothetical protein
MRVGLYRDLAVGVDSAGSRTWSDPHVAVRLATIGAPPDELGPKGQNWGIAPLAPRALAEAGFRPWLEDMRANMRHAGAVRVDHVMGLRRQFWIPAGAGPEDGAYVRYPFEAATAMLALESRRAGCLVVGEDLGTVPPGFRPRCAAPGFLSTKVLYYERDYERAREEGREAAYVPAAEYPARPWPRSAPTTCRRSRAGSAASEVGWRERIGVFTAAEAEAERARRAQDAAKLLDLLRGDGLLAPGEDDPPRLALAAHRWLARTPRGPGPGPAGGPGADRPPGEPAGHGRRAPELAAADGLHARRPAHLALARELLACLREERPRA